MDAFELRRRGMPMALEPQVIEVLGVLVENAGRVVTKDELLDRVWPERYVTEAALNSRVMTARKALGDSGQQQRYIKTVHGRGYRFMLPAQEAEPAVVIPFPVREAPPFGEPATRFVGRREELLAVSALASRAECRLITICGAGGIGKTRLLMEVQRAIAPGAGHPFVSLEHAVEGSVAAMLSAALGAQAGPGTAEDQLLRHLAGREVILFLDNLEHVAGEARMLLVRLLEALPGLRIVCTSRVAISVRHEWLFRLEGLDASDAADLFMERALRARAGHPLADHAAVDRICELVGYLPLAVELAAGLTAYLEPEAIARQIGHDASLLATPLHDVPERHRSLHALFEESCSRLDPRDLAALEACSVFEGAFDSEAAASIIGAGFDGIRRLVDSSLLQTTSGRFVLHPLLRQLLAARAEGRLEATREAHAGHYLGILASLAAALQGPEQLRVVERLDAEFSNIGAAWRWAARLGRVDLISQAQRGLFFLLMRGRYAEGDELARVAIDACVVAEERAPAVPLLVSRSWFLQRLGRIDEAVTCLRQANAVGRQMQLPWTPGYGADARLATAMFRLGAGDYAGAFKTADASRDLSIAADDPPGQAFASWIAGVALLRQASLSCDAEGDTVTYRPAPGDRRVAEAARYIGEAQRLLAGEECWLAGSVAIEAGLQYEYTGVNRLAVAEFERAYELRRRLGDLQGMGNALFYLADVLINQGDWNQADQFNDEAEEYFARIGDATGLAEVTRVRGNIRLAGGDFAGAMDAFRESLGRSMAMGFANNIAGVLRGVSEIHRRNGDLETAAEIVAAVLNDPSTTPASIARCNRAAEWFSAKGHPLPFRPRASREIAASIAAGVFARASD